MQRQFDCALCVPIFSKHISSRKTNNYIERIICEKEADITMDEDTAWLNFASTGKVEDYLIYCTEKYSNSTEETHHENTDKGTYSDRTECR